MRNCQGFFIVFLGAVVLTSTACNKPVPSNNETIAMSSKAVSCRIKIDVPPKPEWEITDANQIYKLFQEPLSKSKEEQHPKRYEILGTASLTYADGSTSAIILFIPLGHFKQDGKYRTADFTVLREFLRQKASKDILELL